MDHLGQGRTPIVTYPKLDRKIGPNAFVLELPADLYFLYFQCETYLNITHLMEVKY